MKTYDWSQVPSEQMNPRLRRQVIHAGAMTVSRLELTQGAVVPRHSHPNEQITMLDQGRLRFDFDDRQEVLEAGQVMVIPGGVPHAVEALADSVARDVFSPVREDWRSGDDAYLRGR